MGTEKALLAVTHLHSTFDLTLNSQSSRPDSLLCAQSYRI